MNCLYLLLIEILNKLDIMQLFIIYNETTKPKTQIRYLNEDSCFFSHREFLSSPKQRKVLNDATSKLS